MLSRLKTAAKVEKLFHMERVFFEKNFALLAVSQGLTAKVKVRAEYQKVKVSLIGGFYKF